MRHADHKANVVTPAGVHQSLATGTALKEAGIDISVVYCSPAARALTTAIKTMEGYGKMLYVHTDPRLADMGVEDPQLVSRLKTAAKETGLEGDAGYAAAGATGEFLPVSQRRGEEGAQAMKTICCLQKGENVLVVTHGVFRLEAAIAALKGKNDGQIERITQNCQIMELILNDAGELVEENWLDPVPVPLEFV